VTISGNITLTALSNGLHNVTVYANDTFGSMGASETISFTVTAPESSETITPEPTSSSEPFPTVQVAVASAASVAVAGAGFLVYFRKRKRQAFTG